ncbi:hypothetical protein KGF57_004902 [Candida theae]|uniref:RRM domain-containing protein n=1 Tax=Candida theae TaxID=1198502 RepID=A0AAD5BA49_9ASCO|nr:uncharacterized protein KGF57_004902 [Candida theae]KAI5949072.1 hypothetical protein KGF57_004902 [Candida theae]
MSSITVSEVPGHITTAQLRRLFQYAGTISAIVPMKRDTIQNLRQYEIIYMSPQAVPTALLLDDVEIEHGYFLRVDKFQERPLEMNGFASHHNGRPTLQQLRKEDIAFTLDFAHGRVFGSDTSDSSWDSVPTADIGQEYKPKSVVLAEIIAGGYDIADAIIDRGVRFDKRYGISPKYQAFIDSLNNYCLKGDMKKAYESEQLKKYFDDSSVAMGTTPQSVDSKVSPFYKSVDHADVREIRNEALKVAQIGTRNSGRAVIKT